jgi:hypothetical protein
MGQRGKIYLSIGEEAIVQSLVEVYGITEIQAIDHVIAQKRELAFIHAQRGNVALAKQIMKEIGEDK